MDLGLAQGIYSNKNEGFANGIYNGVNAGGANGVYNENLLPNNITKKGLVLYLDTSYPKSYPRTGINWNDLSGKNNNSILINPPTYNSINNGTLNFNGTSNYVLCNNSFNDINNQVTLDCWFYATSPASFPVIAGKGYGTGVSQSFTMFISNSTTISGRIATPAVTDISASFSLNNWFNVVLTYNGANMFLYVNGDLKSQSAKTGQMTNPLPFSIGVQQFNGVFNSGFFYGNISIVKLYNIGLTQSEIQRNYQATKSRFGL